MMITLMMMISQYNISFSLFWQIFLFAFFLPILCPCVQFESTSDDDDSKAVDDCDDDDDGDNHENADNCNKREKNNVEVYCYFNTDDDIKCLRLVHFVL